MNILTKNYINTFYLNSLKISVMKEFHSGAADKRTNCFLVSLDKHNNQSLLVEAFFEDALNCIEWDKTAINNNVLARVGRNSMRIAPYELCFFRRIPFH